MTMARRRVPSSGFRPTQESAPVGQYDWGLIALFLMLLCIGLLMVLSASGVVAERINGDKYFFFKRQLIYAVIGGVVMWVLAAVPRHILYKLQYPFLLFVLMLLFVTLSPLGARVNGAQRWISVKFFSIQPLEFAKIALALYLAYFMSTKQELVKTFSKGIIPPFAMTALFCFLLLAQPDFGGAVVLSLILFFMCLIGGTRFIYLFMAIGVGMGGSSQKMFYLPEAHNDFIMAVVGEELGFFGMTLIMVLFAMLFMRCYKIIMGQSDLRDRFSAFGVTLVLAIGATLNLAVVMGMAPPKGVAMPFLSYGGSSLLASMMCIGLLLNFSRTAR